MNGIPPAQMRIVVVSDAAPSRNGVGAYYQDLCHLLEPQVQQLELICPQIVEGKWQVGLVFPMPGDSTQKICFPNYWHMKQTLKDIKPHVVVVATPGVYGLCAARLATRMGIPFIKGFHTSFEHLTELYWGNTLSGKLIEWYFRKCNGYLFRRTALVLGNSESILAQAKTMGAEDTQLIGTPLAKDFLHPLPLPHSGSFQHLLFAGRLAREKNLEALLQAAETLPALSFSIAGDGPIRAEIEEACERLPNLRYLGWLDRGRLREVIDAHDALLLPSHYETFGTIALEAMAREKLVIVSKGCGISLWPELASGLTVIADDSTLTDTLKSISELDLSSRQTLAQQARIKALALNDAVLHEWLNVISRVIAGKKDS